MHLNPKPKPGPIVHFRFAWLCYGRFIMLAFTVSFKLALCSLLPNTSSKQGGGSRNKNKTPTANSKLKVKVPDAGCADGKG
jgi:hypothetical protein